MTNAFGNDAIYSSIDVSLNIDEFRRGRCKQFNDLLDSIMMMIDNCTKGAPAKECDDLTYATAAITELIDKGIEMASSCKYFESRNEEHNLG